MENVEIRPTQRLYSLDGLRGIMCIGIALYHYVPQFFIEGHAFHSASRYFAYFTDIFFVFGGFFAGKVLFKPSLTKRDYADFVVGKFARLYPLHLVTVCFYVAIAAFMLAGIIERQAVHRYDLGSLVPHLTLTHAAGFGEFVTFNYPSWAISAIFACCLALPSLRFATRSRFPTLGLTLAFCIVLVVGALLAKLYSSHIAMMQRESLGLVRCAPSFVFGIILSKYRHVKLDKRLSLALLTLSCAALFLSGRPLMGVPRLLSIYVLVVSLVALDVAGTWTPLHIRPLRTLAKYSFGIYLLHSVVATLLFQIAAPKITGAENIRLSPVIGSLFLLAGLAITLGLAVFSLRTIEPGGERLVKRLYARAIAKRSARSARAVSP